MSITDSIIYLVDDDLALCNSIVWLLQSVNLNVVYFNKAQDFLDNYNPQTTWLFATGHSHARHGWIRVI